MSKRSTMWTPPGRENTARQDIAPSRSGAQSVARALRVIEALAESAGTATEISERVGLTRPTAARLLAALCDERYAIRSDRGVFSLGSRFLELANRETTTTALGGIVQPFLDHLMEASGETCHAAMREGLDCVCIAKSESRNSIRLSLSVGVRRPLHAGAIARTVLAYSPRAVIESVLSAPLERFTPSTPIDRRQLRRGLEDICRRGYAESDRELDEFASAMAAPVFGDSEHALVTFGISGPSNRFSTDVREKLVTPLLEVSAVASAALKSSAG